MTLFCFLFIPFIYLFQRSVRESDSTGGVWALLLGSIIALIKFFLGDLVNPGGFGFNRFISGCIDIVSLPALIPVIVYLFFVNFKIIGGTMDFAGFALLWLIPEAGIRAIGWSSLSDPILLVLVPVLWAAIAIGIAFFITLIQNSRGWLILLFSLAILLIPFAASASYWAFYSQKTLIGFLLLFTASSPMLVSLTLSFLKAGD